MSFNQKRIVTTMDFQFDPSKHAHTVDGISQTVPDQALSPRTLIERYTLGRPLPQMNGVYTGEDGVIPDDFERWTIQEQIDYKREVDSYVESKTNELKQIQERKQKFAEEQRQKEFAELQEFKKKFQGANENGD